MDRDGGHSQRIPYQKHLLKQLLAQVPSGSGIKTSFRDVIGNAIKNGGEHFNARRLPGLVKLINDHELEGQVADHFRTLLEHSFIFDEVKEIDNAGEEEVYSSSSKTNQLAVFSEKNLPQDLHEGKIIVDYLMLR